ncbi:MAG TPA: AAA family ATPase [Vicinamibacterales bacterium]|jgi:hypothetical protein
MVTEDQSAVVAFLASPAAHGGVSVERIDTHSAIVFLAGQRAWKLKRAVRFDYLDFSSPERRKVLCEAEVRLNRRTAPALYHGVVPVTRDAHGSLAIGGAGAPVDWLVEMSRFDQEALLDRLAAKGRLALDMMAPLADAVARFHAAAEPRSDHGGADGMRWVIEGNASGFGDHRDLLDPSTCARLTDDSLAELDRRAARLDARRGRGLVRQCHGDLHLRNIVWIDDRPTLFDAVEFNDEIACTDVLYDLAFLVMDLWRRQLPRHANSVWNGYLSRTGDIDGVSLMPLFLSCRAAVRAKTSATAARVQPDPRQAGSLREHARTYLTLAERLLRSSPPVLVAVGGLSGSGKSTLAFALAPAVGTVPGALVFRSDSVRKQLCGVSELEQLGPEGYTPGVSARVYATLGDRARLTITSGHAAIVDAVYARPEEREAIESIAADAGIPFVGLWLDAPEKTLIERVEHRRMDPSDADAAVIRRQHSQEIGAMRWNRVDAGRPVDDVLRDALRFVSDGRTVAQ